MPKNYQTLTHADPHENRILRGRIREVGLGQETEAAVTVQDGEMFIESGASLSAWAPSQGARK
jgi:hypothetical protein